MNNEHCQVIKRTNKTPGTVVRQKKRCSYMAGNAEMLKKRCFVFVSYTDFCKNLSLVPKGGISFLYVICIILLNRNNQFHFDRFRRKANFSILKESDEAESDEKKTAGLYDCLPEFSAK